MPVSLEQLHARARRSPLLLRFTAFTRLLLAIGFIPPGLKKVLGHAFTPLPVTDPVGAFFHGFFQAGAYYQFVGWAQVTAALLLLIPATATLGAVLYTPIILNIAIITVTIGFQGTQVLTVLMVLACVYLLCWDYDRLKGLLPARRRGPRAVGRREYAAEAAGWGAAGAAAYGLAAWAGLGGIGARLGWTGVGVGLAGGAVFGLVLAWHLRQTPASLREDASDPKPAGVTTASVSPSP